MSVTNKLQPITETSCLVNVMHEILVDRWNRGIPSIAVCPSQRLENVVGFDVALPEFEKLLVMQFKAYKRHKNKALDYFKLYNTQHNTLLQYPPNCAFYVFPDYKTHAQMMNDRHLEYLGHRYLILNNTWFVEVHSIPKGARKVSRNDLATGNVPNVKWRQLSIMIRSCEAGFRIVMVRQRYILQDPDEKTVEILKIPRGRFSFYYTQTKTISKKKKPWRVS